MHHTQADEGSLLVRLRAGDDEAFRDVVNQYDAGLRRFARGYLSTGAAEEAVGDTWAKVSTSVHKFEGRSSLKTWIYRILINTLRTSAAREGRVVPFSALGHDTPDLSADRTAELLADSGRGPGYFGTAASQWDELPAEVLEREELLETILAAVDQLPPAQREVVQLRDLEGLSAADASSALGITAVNQRVLLHRGRVAVRRVIEEYLTHAR